MASTGDRGWKICEEDRTPFSESSLRPRDAGIGSRTRHREGRNNSAVGWVPHTAWHASAAYQPPNIGDPLQQSLLSHLWADCISEDLVQS